MQSTSASLKAIINLPIFHTVAKPFNKGLEPTRVAVKGAEVVFTYEFEGKGALMVFEAAWSLTWGRFYCLKTTHSDFFFSWPEPILMGEVEMWEEMEGFFSSEEFKLKEGEAPSEATLHHLSGLLLT